jgi:hypothetical protein
MKRSVTIIFIFIAIAAFPQKIDDIFKTMPNSPVPGNSYRNHTSMRVDHNVISPSFICIPIGEDLPKFISQKVKFYFETASIDSCK